MDNNRKEGSKQGLKGKFNEVVGDLTGDERQERLGRAQQDLGDKQREFGEARDRARDVGASPD